MGRRLQLGLPLQVERCQRDHYSDTVWDGITCGPRPCANRSVRRNTDGAPRTHLHRAAMPTLAPCTAAAMAKKKVQKSPAGMGAFVLLRMLCQSRAKIPSACGIVGKRVCRVVWCITWQGHL